MINRIGLYLFRNLLIATVMSTIAVTMTIWVTQSLKLLDMVINAGAPFLVFLWMMSLTVPTFIGVIMPIALAGAILFSYNKLLMDSELVVMRAVGMGPWRLAAPALALAGIISATVYILNIWASPYANRELVRLQYAVRHEFATVLIREGAFNDVSDRMTVYLRKRMDNGEMQGLLVHDTRQAGKDISVMAQRGVMADSPGGVKVIMLDGLRQEVDLKTGRMSELYFDRYLVDFQVADDRPVDRTVDPRERSLPELVNPPPDIRANPYMMRQFAAELHMRLSTPLLALSFAIIALAALLGGDYNRRGHGRRIAAAALLVVALQSASLGLTGLAGKLPAVIPLMYLLYLAPLAPGAWLLSRR
jgi:lipopolysaccharide export system permease protein